MPSIEDQTEQLALSYGPEDAFALHRHHRPPPDHGRQGARADHRPGLPRAPAVGHDGVAGLIAAVSVASQHSGSAKNSTTP